MGLQGRFGWSAHPLGGAVLQILWGTLLLHLKSGSWFVTVVPTAWQDEALARDGVSREVVQTGRHWVVHSLEGTAGVKAFVGGGSPRVEETAGGCAAAAEQAQRKVGRR